MLHVLEKQGPGPMFVSLVPQPPGNPISLPDGRKEAGGLGGIGGLQDGSTGTVANGKRPALVCCQAEVLHAAAASRRERSRSSCMTRAAEQRAGEAA